MGTSSSRRLRRTERRSSTPTSRCRRTRRSSSRRTDISKQGGQSLQRSRSRDVHIFSFQYELYIFSFHYELYIFPVFCTSSMLKLRRICLRAHILTLFHCLF